MSISRALAALLLLGACSKAPASAPDAGALAKAEVRVEPDCTASTPLVEGIPGSPGHLIPSERNPNGDSELAALMRRMQADIDAARGNVLKGEVPKPLYALHRRIRCSWTTDPKDRNAAFDGFAVSYLEAVKALDAATDKKTAFVGVVKTCRACHEQSCPGPLAAIEKLELPK